MPEQTPNINQSSSRTYPTCNLDTYRFGLEPGEVAYRVVCVNEDHKHFVIRELFRKTLKSGQP